MADGKPGNMMEAEEELKTGIKLECDCEEHTPDELRPMDVHVKEEFEYELSANITGELGCQLEWTHAKLEKCHSAGHKTDSVMRCTTLKHEDFEEPHSDRSLISSSTTYSCFNCHFKTARKRKLVAHTKKHIAEKSAHQQLNNSHADSQLCKFCDFTTPYAGNMKRHMFKHKNEKPFNCHTCEYKCSTKVRLREHITAIHSKDKPYSCDLCDYRCVTRYRLKIHKMAHTGQTRFTCHKCDFGCMHRSDFEFHLGVHSGSVTYFSCDICDFKCSRAGNLKKHKTTHSVEKPYACDQCEYRSTRPDVLKKHLKRHTGEKPFACHMCDYNCNRFDLLQNHLAKHPEDEYTESTRMRKPKRLTCSLCDFKCCQPAVLKNHMMTHTGERPFGCNVCGRRYRLSTYLKAHMMDHTGEKPFWT